MKRYIVHTGEGERYNAASKARRDAEEIAVRLGYEPVLFAGNRSAEGSAPALFRLAGEAVRNWRSLVSRAEPDSLVLVQYPHYPLKTALFYRGEMKRARRKGIRFAALIHDLDSLRGIHGWAAKYCDRFVLPEFDMMICHNEKMKAYLVEKGIPEDRLVVLHLFDYLTEAEGKEKGEGLAVAGNLSEEKSGYIHQLIWDTGLTLHLYGKGLDGKSLPARARVHGAYPPEELPEKLEGKFGLVWDGPEISGCAGKQGEYLRCNNPHKLSLYLAAGMPVMIWSQAAAADFVRRQGVGICVDSLLEADTAMKRAADYAQMRRRAGEIGAQVREGRFLTEALRRVEERLERDGRK